MNANARTMHATKTPSTSPKRTRLNSVPIAIIGVETAKNSSTADRPLWLFSVDAQSFDAEAEHIHSQNMAKRASFIRNFSSACMILLNFRNSGIEFRKN